jgi:mediator of replication checkpoint protein 1
MSKYKVGTAVDYDEDDPFRTSALPRAPKETGADRNADSDSGTDVEMPGISEILAQKEACESQRAQKERLQQLKLAAIAQQQQKRASTSAGSPPGAEQDSDDDGLDVVPDTMHSVARDEAAARAAAGHTQPSAGRTTQLRFARVAASPQRNDPHSITPATDESPEKLIAAAAQSTFISSLARGGAAAGRGKRNMGMTKADLERMVLRSAEAQSEQLRREKEEEWVRRGGRVVGVMEVVGEEKIQELIGEALERSGDTPAKGDGCGDADSDDDDDADYVPIERGSASPQQEKGEQEEVQMPIEEKRANMDERAEDNNDSIAEAVSQAETEVDSETESGAPNDVRLRRRTARPRHIIIGSDDEDGPPAASTDIRPPPLSLLDLPSPAFTSTSSSRPSGNAEHPDHDHDHENDPDVSGNDTDKENRAVVRRDVSGSAPTHGARVLFDDILSTRAGIGAALQPSVLPADDDPFAFTPSPAKAREQAMRRLGSPAPKPFAGKRGLSQMFEEEEGDGLGSVPALMIQGVDGERATPSEMNAGLEGFKPVLGGLSQAFEETQVILMLSLELYVYILALTTRTLHV